jgi:glycolate oxidase
MATMNMVAEKPQAVIDQLRSLLPDEGLITDAAGMKPYECDGLTAIREEPWVVALPETEAQVQKILQICHAHSVPVVPRGAGTGLSGGARPMTTGVVLGLSKMNRILDIDPHNCIARLQPGVRNLAISQAAEVHGLYYAPDPSSQIACSIGGNVAENSGGVHCLKYGLTVHNLRGVRVVTMTGEVLELGGPLLDNPGLDLLAVMCGSEGMLGIVTEVTVALLPKPPAVVVMLAAFDAVNKAGQAVADIISNGIIPAGMEMMDQLAVRAAEQFAQAGYPQDAAAILIIELDGAGVEIDSLAAMVSRIVENAGAKSVDIATDPTAQARLWKGRKSAFPAVGRLAPDYYCMDGTIPRRHLASVLKRINELSAEYQLSTANVFHAGDGNLHPLIMYDANIPGELERTEELGGKILELCVEMGGTITGEHGVGVEKINQMCSQFQAAELQQFHAVKEAFDPLRLLNPGKAVPTLHRCAELGAMHVHHNQLPHSDLPRF